MINTRKERLRDKIWDILEKNNININHCHGRIPNFCGSTAAADILRGLDEWAEANVIFCSPDSAQQRIREYTLVDGKDLIMPSPKLQKGYFIIKAADVEGRTKIASSISGAFRYGKTLNIFPKVDMVIEGSVAVDLNGNRLGKGGGYGDTEISHLFNEDSINNKTHIVTIVHQVQIVENIPMESHDQKINMIVTPNEVIRIKIS